MPQRTRSGSAHASQTGGGGVISTSTEPACLTIRCRGLSRHNFLLGFPGSVAPLTSRTLARQPTVTKPAPPPRIFTLIARAANLAVVLRRGPSKQCACLRWNLTTDEVEEGQWVKAKIYARRSDVSPCGKYMVYFALDGRWNTWTRGAYSAISTVPYFSALQLYPQGSTYGGGAVWCTRLYETIGIQQVVAPLPPQATQEFGLGDARVYFPRLIRDGWTLTNITHYNGVHVSSGVFERPLGAGMTLRKRVVELPVSETHVLVDPEGTIIEEYPEWDWADYYSERILFAKGGILYASPVREGRPMEPKFVTDLNLMRFRAVAPPYAALNRAG